MTVTTSPTNAVTPSPSATHRAGDAADEPGPRRRPTTRPHPQPGPTVRILAALVRADLLSFVREPVGFVMCFLYPLFILLIFHTVFPGEIQDGVTYAQYLLPAMLTTGIMTNSLQNLATDVAAQREQGALSRLQVLPAPTWAYVAGKTLFSAILSLANAVLLIGVARTQLGVDLPATTHAWLLFLLTTALMTGVCTALGLVIGRTRPSARAASALVTPVVLVLQFVSGIFFPLPQLPSWLVTAASVFPARWSAGLMREAFLPSSVQVAEPTGSWETGKALAVVTAWLVVAMVAAVVVSRRDTVDR